MYQYSNRSDHHIPPPKMILALKDQPFSSGRSLAVSSRGWLSTKCNGIEEIEIDKTATLSF